MSGQRRPIQLVMSTIAWVFLAVAIIASSPKTAFAHAVLVSSSPGQGEHLAASPKEFRLHFSEPVGHVATSVVSRDGKLKELKSIVSGAEVIVPSGTLGDGVYALNWRVVSEDGHPVAASIVFTVGERDADTPLTNTAGGADVPTSAITWATKFVFYLSCLFGVGGVFFALHIERQGPGKGYLAFLVVGGLSAVLSAWLIGVELTASSLTSIFEFDTWLAACDTSLGRCVGVTLVSLALAAAAVIWPRYGRTLSLASFVLVGPAFALTGHASGAGLKWLSFSAVALHVMAATFWVGALPRLWHVLRSHGMATATFETTPDLRFDVEVYLQNAEFDELDPKEVRLVMAAADTSVSPFQIEVTKVAPGLWRATGVQAPCNCDWNLKIEMLVTDFDLVTLKGHAKLRP